VFDPQKRQFCFAGEAIICLAIVFVSCPFAWGREEMGGYSMVGKQSLVRCGLLKFGLVRIFCFADF
jgi:hypothetical protein